MSWYCLSAVIFWVWIYFLGKVVFCDGVLGAFFIPLIFLKRASFLFLGFGVWEGRRLHLIFWGDRDNVYVMGGWTMDEKVVYNESAMGCRMMKKMKMRRLM